HEAEALRGQPVEGGVVVVDERVEVLLVAPALVRADHGGAGRSGRAGLGDGRIRVAAERARRACADGDLGVLLEGLLDQAAQHVGIGGAGGVAGRGRGEDERIDEDDAERHHRDPVDLAILEAERYEQHAGVCYSPPSPRKRLSWSTVPAPLRGVRSRGPPGGPPSPPDEWTTASTRSASGASSCSPSPPCRSWRSSSSPS